jgi:alpha-ketoglutarate-dependent taurine dioxygenase
VRLVGLEPVDNHGGSAMTRAPQLRPLGAALGTGVLRIDRSKPLGTGTFAGIQATFAEHPVLVFREQDLGALERAAFGRRFGAPRPHALTGHRHVDCPEVSRLTNVEETGQIDWYGVKRATEWHTDSEGWS